MRRPRASFFRTATVPEIVGLTLAEAEIRVGGAGLILACAQEQSLGRHRESRSERIISWQQPEVGVQLQRMEMVVAGFGPRGGGLSGDREPRNPSPKPWSEPAVALRVDDEETS
jgi:hypothetical protein